MYSLNTALIYVKLFIRMGIFCFGEMLSVSKNICDIKAVNFTRMR